MAKKSKVDVPPQLSGITDGLTTEEKEYATYLFDIYCKELASDCNLESTILKKYNYQGLFELGCHTPHPIVSKLLKTNHNTACHLIVAHGYVSNRF